MGLFDAYLVILRCLNGLALHVNEIHSSYGGPLAVEITDLERQQILCEIFFSKLCFFRNLKYSIVHLLRTQLGQRNSLYRKPWAFFVFILRIFAYSGHGMNMYSHIYHLSFQFPASYETVTAVETGTSEEVSPKDYASAFVSDLSDKV